MENKISKGCYKIFLIGILSLLLMGGCNGTNKGSSKDIKGISSKASDSDSTLERDILETDASLEDDTGVSEAEADKVVIKLPPPDNLLAAALSHSSIAIIWQDNSDNESAFNIERRAETEERFSDLAVVEAVRSSGSNGFYEDSELLPDTTYCYRVRAYNSKGPSKYSSETCVDTKHKPISAPTAATGSAANIGFNSATLTGTVNPNGSRTGGFFQWGLETSSFENTTPLKGLGGGMSNVDVSADLTGLLLDTTYYYRIAAVAENGKTAFGSHKSFTTLKLPEHLFNGSFSSGTWGWHLAGDFWAGTNLTKYRTSPGYAAGGVDSKGRTKYNSKGSMYQVVTIPEDATLAVLSFWLNVTSDESTAVKQHDKLHVEIFDSRGEFLEELSRYSNLDRRSDVIYSAEYFDLTRYKGRTIRIQFRAATDGVSYTIFRIDDVSLMSDG